VKLEKPQKGWVIAATFVVALILAATPMPEWARYWRPEWVALALIYWCMALPQRVGVGIGWLLGLLEDVIKGALLGQHAIGMAIIAFIVVRTHQRIRVFPFVQQAIIVFFLISLSRLLVLWVKGVIGQAPGSFSYLLPALTSMLLWPWVYIILRDIRRRYKVR